MKFGYFLFEKKILDKFYFITSSSHHIIISASKISLGIINSITHSSPSTSLSHHDYNSFPFSSGCHHHILIIISLSESITSSHPPIYYIMIADCSEIPNVHSTGEFLNTLLTPSMRILFKIYLRIVHLWINSETFFVFSFLTL